MAGPKRKSGSHSPTVPSCLCYLCTNKMGAFRHAFRGTSRWPTSILTLSAFLPLCSFLSLSVSRSLALSPASHAERLPSPGRKRLRRPRQRKEASTQAKCKQQVGSRALALFPIRSSVEKESCAKLQGRREARGCEFVCNLCPRRWKTPRPIMSTSPLFQPVCGEMVQMVAGWRCCVGMGCCASACPADFGPQNCVNCVGFCACNCSYCIA